MDVQLHSRHFHILCPSDTLIPLSGGDFIYTLGYCLFPFHYVLYAFHTLSVSTWTHEVHSIHWFP